jgi:hypothetical protein
MVSQIPRSQLQLKKGFVHKKVAFAPSDAVSNFKGLSTHRSPQQPLRLLSRQTTSQPLKKHKTQREKRLRRRSLHCAA